MKNKKTESADNTEPGEELSKVFLHNDDRTSMEFVVFVLMAVFDKSLEDATKVMMQVHNEGQGIAGSYTFPIASAKVSAVLEMAKAKGFPLRCTTENKSCDREEEDQEPTNKTKKHELPAGWIMAGSYPADYEVAIDKGVFHSGTRSACVTHAIESARGFGTLMQQSSPDNYLQKRVRMKMWVKTEGVLGRVQPWMRIDGGRRAKMLGFDNACDRHIEGTTDWSEFAIVLDVPEESTNIAFGIMLAGEGKLWLDDISFEEVGGDVPTTDCPCQTGRRGTNQNPKNLNFEE